MRAAERRLAARYTALAQWLHWVMALLLFALVAIGLYLADLPGGPARSNLISLHKSLGLTAGLLILLRIAWRWRQAPPPLQALPAWQRRAAQITHGLLYLLMLLLPLTGYLRSAFSPYPVKWFGLGLPAWATPDRGLNQLFGSLHDAAAWALIGLIAVHLAAVAWHAWQGPRDVLQRMLPPGIRQSSSSRPPPVQQRTESME